MCSLLLRTAVGVEPMRKPTIDPKFLAKALKACDAFSYPPIEGILPMIGSGHGPGGVCWCFRFTFERLFDAARKTTNAARTKPKITIEIVLKPKSCLILNRKEDTELILTDDFRDFGKKKNLNSTPSSTLDLTEFARIKELDKL